MWRLLTLLLVLGSIFPVQGKGGGANLFADSSCSTYDLNPGCCSSVFTECEVYADVLYWRPTFDGVQYATLNPGPSEDSNPLFITPDNQWGYRIGARAEILCDYYVEGNYTHWHQSNDGFTEGFDQIFPVFAPIDFAVIFDRADCRIDSTYIAADIVGGIRWLNCNCLESHIFLGTRYFRIKETEEYLYLNLDTVVPASQKYSLTGWGARIGLDFFLSPFNYAWLCPFKIGAHIAHMAGFGNQVNYVQSSASVGFFPQGNLDFPDRFTTVLETDMSIELQYAVNVGCVEFTVRGGYELNYYQNARKRIDSTNTLGIAPRSTSSMGYGGPYLGLALAY